MLAQQIRELIITPAFQSVGLWSESSDILVYGTGHVESGYRDIIQQPKGVALGFFQMEPATYLDHRHWLTRGMGRKYLKPILALCYYDILPTDPMFLCSDIKFAALMCRIDYLRAKPDLPNPNDAMGFANYHKKHYNSYLGKTHVLDSVNVFQQVIDRTL